METVFRRVNRNRSGNRRRNTIRKRKYCTACKTRAGQDEIIPDMVKHMRKTAKEIPGIIKRDNDRKWLENRHKYATV